MRVNHLPYLDGVRAIAVIMVLLSHFPFVQGSTLSHAFSRAVDFTHIGYFGVDIFFVLSGFLITRLLLKERADYGRISFRAFYMRRALRIFPIYFLCVFASILVWTLGTDQITALLTYTFNFYKPFHPAPSPLEHTWSLSVEEQFYLAWPAIVSLLPFASGRRVTLLIIPGCAVLTAIALALSLPSVEASAAIYMFTTTRMLSLSLGAALAYMEAEDALPSARLSVRLAIFGGVLLATIFVLRSLSPADTGGLYWPATLVAYALICFASVAALVGAQGGLADRARKTLSSAPCRYVGRMSYGLYLYHLPLLFLLNIQPAHVETTGASAARTALAWALTFAVAHISFAYIETPFLRLKTAWTRSASHQANLVKP